MTRYQLGKVKPFWDKSYRDFPYVRQPLLPSEIDEWRRKGYVNFDRFSGSMYTSKNPMPVWIKGFENLFNLKNQTYLFYKMTTLEIMPEHQDHYQTYIKLFNPDIDRIRRVLVLLEDWRPGHYLEVDGVPIVNWRRGDWVKWHNYVPHAAANIGIEDRYTLQITGEEL